VVRSTSQCLQFGELLKWNNGKVLFFSPHLGAINGVLVLLSYLLLSISAVGRNKDWAVKGYRLNNWPNLFLF